MKKKCSFCKKVSKAIIEDWYALDFALFGFQEPFKVLEEEQLKEYRQLKPTLLINIYELYNILGYGTDNKYTNGISEVKKTQFNVVKNIYNDTKEYMKNNKKFKKIIKEEIKLNKKKDIYKITKENFLRTCLDKLLLEKAILSSNNLKVLESMEGKLMLDAHRFYRDKVIGIAVNCKKC